MKYSNERAAQILISLLKQHNIKRIIASPGTTNLSFVGSAMADDFFEIYSSVDERSAAYMACGLAEETQEPVVISCTGATASRNYMPGLTEAYYRKLPVLAVTASQPLEKIGHLSPQMLDRRNLPNDIARRSYFVKAVRNADDEWADEIAINSAILELKRHGGGPVHINLETAYCLNYDVTELRAGRKIDRITPDSTNWPSLDGKKIGVFIASHTPFSPETTDAINRFCGQHDAVVFTDHTSAYNGPYKVQMALQLMQKKATHSLAEVDILIHLGGVTGDYGYLQIKPKEVWRVDADGEIRDTFRKLKFVFEMTDLQFFTHYAQEGGQHTEYLNKCKAEYEALIESIPELPFSNPWIAMKTAPLIPDNSTIHLAILNTLRSWNYFNFSNSVSSNCNVGGFGIDGIMSTLVGASLANKDKLYFGIIGDLAFFYDMNSLGNRHVGKNLRIMLINNGRGTEFRNYDHPGAQFGNNADAYIAAAGHYGNKSHDLVKHYAEDLGFQYLTASTKEEFLKEVAKFTNPEITDKPILFEVFTDFQDESNAQEIIHHLRTDSEAIAKDMARSILGEKGIKTIKKILGK